MKLELKHLAPYLPYGLKGEIFNDLDVITGLDIEHSIVETLNNGNCLIDNFKPILRPLEDLKKSGVDFGVYNNDNLQEFNKEIIYGNCSYNSMKILLKNHFDVFGLIPNGLAIDINTIN